MTTEQMNKGFQLERKIERFKKNLQVIIDTNNMLDQFNQPRASIIAPDLSQDTTSYKKEVPDAIGMEFVVSALPNNFFLAYVCNLEIQIQCLEQEFKNL